MYQALYRKWRPKTFNDVVGQEHISETLKRQIQNDRLSHAYLFVGTRGTGKTTCAKILARAINCTAPNGGNPCNKCASCIGIDSGSIMDVLELDAASNNGVDNVRALREEAVFTPVDVKKRVYIIDEVHMLSIAAFNALLKILEEPPEHLIFILATTDIHKVPATILSRCQRYTFKRILPEKTAERLLYVADQEGITLTKDAAKLLARLSDGSLRDALSLFDQCAAEDTVDYTRVLDAIGLAGSDDIVSILEAIADYNVFAALEQLDKLYNGGKVMLSVLEELTDLVRDALVTALMPKGGTGLLSGAFDNTVLTGFAERFGVEQLLSLIDVFRTTMLELTKGADGKLTVELCLMRACSNLIDGGTSAKPSHTPEFEDAAPFRSVAPVAENSARMVPPVATTPNPQPSYQAKTSPSVAQTQETVGESAPKKPIAASDDLWKQALGLVKSKIDDSKYSILSDPTQCTAVFDDTSLTIKAKNVFAPQIVNVPQVTEALKEIAESLLGKPLIVRVIQDSGNNSISNDKLDALMRFPNIKIV